MRGKKPKTQLECYAAVLSVRTEGFIPAPETSHAIQCVIQEAKKAKKREKKKSSFSTGAVTVSWIWAAMNPTAVENLLITHDQKMR